MKTIRKSALLFALLVGGAALFTGCREDETVDLAGYPETPAGIAIAGTDKTSATYQGTYDEAGELKLSGSLSKNYVVTLAQASPENVYVRVEPIVVNLPADKVTISATELVIPAGSVASETIEVTFDDTDMQFMADELAGMVYELGVRITAVEGFQVSLSTTEAKVSVEKVPYLATASTVLEDGGSEALFKRKYYDGTILNEEPIACTLKIVLDRPVVKDTKFVLKSSGIPEAFQKDETITPAEVTVAAGEKESEAITWTLTDDFLLTSEDPETHHIVLRAEPVDGGATVSGSDANVEVTVSKTFSLLDFLTEPNPDWLQYDTTGWNGETNGYGDIPDLFDGSLYTDVYESSWGGEGYLWFTIDMLEAREIHGVIMTQYGSIKYMGERFALSTSDDGETWTQLGELSTDEISSSPYYITFRKPITARYIKYEGWKGSKYAPDIAEFYVQGKK